MRRNPLKVGERYKVKIEKLTKLGDGYTRIKGVSVFVKNVEIGWEGEVKIVKVGKTWAVAVPV